MSRVVPSLLLIFIMMLQPFTKANAAFIKLHTHNAVAWLPQQQIHGSLVGFTAATVIIHHDATTFTIAVNGDNSFTIALTLHDANNHIWAAANNRDTIVFSDTVNLQLGYHPTPLIKPYAVVNSNTATLHATTIANPWKQLQYHWTGDNRNPAPVKIRNANDSITPVFIPPVDGVYYFNLAVVQGKDTARFQTYITNKANKLRPFNMDSLHAAWIDDAVIYEITPHAFVKNATYDDVTAKLPEIKSLGVNTIWLQPVFKCNDRGQGYEVTDYFSLREDLGSEAQLGKLIQTAKSLGLKVLFDFVPNHTSIYHPYAKDCATYQTDSHYYDFYQHTDDGVMYSSNYHKDSAGFIYYFWSNLVNLDYDNKEVQQWIAEACKYWLQKYDLDGYRFDAVWGVNARQPNFGKRLQLELKTIKPDILLLAEDKGAISSTYAKGFDAAYDWTADTNWVSHWSWQYDYSASQNKLIFNYPNPLKRGQLLRTALFDNGDAAHPRLHFTENNDVPRFIAVANAERTKMAAALTFALPGIPLIYNGQEAGIATMPSMTNPTFKRDQSIRSLDKDSLFSFYQRLNAIRAAHSSFRNNKIDEVAVFPAAAMAAFRRSNENEDIITVINMNSLPAIALLNLYKILPKGTGAFTLTDLITGEVFNYKNAALAKLPVRMSGYSTRMLLVGAPQKNWVVLDAK